MAKIRIHMAVANGQLTAFKNRTNSPKFDKRGGWAGNFDVDMQRIGGGGPGWNGASWVMWRTTAEAAADEPDFESFLTDVVQTANTNTTGSAPHGAAVQFIYQIHEDDYPGQSPRAGFDAMIASVVLTPWGLERVITPGP